MLKYKIIKKETAGSFILGFHLRSDEVKRLFREKLVTREGVPVAEDEVLLPGMALSIETPNNRVPTLPAPFPREIEIVYLDQDIVVCVKPAGIVIYDDAVSETLLSCLRYTLERRKTADALYPIQRLDRDTQGLILFARNYLASAYFSYMMEHNGIEKTYTALVHGKFREKDGTISLPIGHDRHNSNHYIVLKKGKSAITHYETMKATNVMSLVRAKIDTGRTHQIRVHFSSLGHPIYGDEIYGKKDADYLRLISTDLKFRHPGSEKAMHFMLTLPAGFSHPEEGHYA